MKDVRRIESLRNPIVAEVVSALRKRAQHRHEAFVLEGAKLLSAALGSRGGRCSVGRVFYTSSWAGRVEGLVSEAQGRGAEVYEVTESVLAKLTTTETPQGVVALGSYRPWLLEELPVEGMVIVSDAIRDPGNLGAIVRTADAAGASAVVMLEGTCDAFMPKVLRASAGSVFNVPMAYARAEEAMGMLRGRGFRVVVTSPRGAVSIFEADLRGPVAMVLGNEAGGVGGALLESADLNVRIPIRGGAESLNVAAAAAVCLYEAIRQRERV